MPAAPVQGLAEVLADPQVQARGMAATVLHPTAGVVVAPGNPLQGGTAPAAPDTPAPRLGEHTDDVLSTLLGYSPERLAALRAAGVVG